MNEVLINNWNNAVTGADRVFLLGDFSFGNKEKQGGNSPEIKWA